MKNKKLNIFDAGVAFLLALVLAQFTSAIGIAITEVVMDACGQTSAQIATFFDSALGYLLQALYMNIAFVLVFVWYFKRINKQEIVAKPTSKTAKYVGICIIIGISTLFLLSGTLNYFQLLIDKLGFTSSSIPYELNSPSSYIISLISLAVIPAICEELIFRGVLVTALKSKGKIFAVIISSIMFAIFHFSPSQLIYPFCFGLILSIIFLRTNNIIFSILLHFINNALSLSIQYFSSNSGVAFTHSASNLIYAIITLAIWIVLIIYLFKDFISTTNATTINNNLSNQSIDKQPVATTVSQQDSTSSANENEKLNKIVLYGSIAIMVLIYIMLISI